MHDPKQQARQHPPHRRLGLDPGAADAGRVAVGHLGPQPAEVEHTIDADQHMVVRDQIAQRPHEHKLMLTTRAMPQHPSAPKRPDESEPRQGDFFNGPVRLA